MKRLELYLYLFLTAAVWIIPTYLQYILGYSGQFAAKAIALPFLAWIVLSVKIKGSSEVVTVTQPAQISFTIGEPVQIDLNGSRARVEPTAQNQ